MNIKKFVLGPFMMVLMFNSLIGQSAFSERIFTLVESMPRAAGCPINQENMYKLDLCTKNYINTQIAKIMKYPESSLANNIQGICIVQIIIDTFGRITQPIVQQSATQELDMEALRIIDTLAAINNSWIPGTQGSKKVRVAIKIPIDFNIKSWNLIQEKTRKEEEEMARDSMQKSKNQLDSLKKK